MQGQFNDMCAMSRRQAILTDYSDEILAIYETVAESMQANIPPPLNGTMHPQRNSSAPLFYRSFRTRFPTTTTFSNTAAIGDLYLCRFTCGNADSF